MSEDEITQEKKDVLFETAELEEAIGCIESKLLGAVEIFTDLGRKLPHVVSPPKSVVEIEAIRYNPLYSPENPYPPFEELKHLVTELQDGRKKLRVLQQRRSKLYPTTSE